MAESGMRGTRPRGYYSRLGELNQQIKRDVKVTLATSKFVEASKAREAEEAKQALAREEARALDFGSTPEQKPTDSASDNS